MTYILRNDNVADIFTKPLTNVEERRKCVSTILHYIC